MVIVGVFTLIGGVVGNRLKSKFAKYSQMPSSGNHSGAEVAKQMLDYYGVNDVKIVEGKGSLTDHYNPLSKTIALSPEVYRGQHVSAAAVAAHECGHAIQHANAYGMLKLRSTLVPVVNFSSRMQQFLFYGMMFGFMAGGGSALGQILMLALVATFGMTALFSLITLPVEFDASRRALVWLDNSGVTVGEQYDGAKDALWWAAMTYVVQALSSLVLFLYFLMQMMGRD